MKNSTTLLLCVLSFFLTNAQNKSDKQIEKEITAALVSQFKQNEPGASILVARKGAIIYKKAFGSASLELNAPMQPDMVFNLASITKQFTAVAILQLLEQGKVALQDTVQKFIPDFPSKAYPITIENLLTHTSGIKDYLQINYSGPYIERWDFSPAELIDSFKALPLEFEPGTRFRYSNSGYFLLGYIIEKVTGKSYQTYLLENILQPLGLTHTYTDDPNAVIPKRVYGYKKEDNVFKKADYWSATISYAAGGLISNVEDLYEWHKGLYSYKIIKKETLEKAFTAFKLKDGTSTDYGYGWFIKNINGVRSIEHDGAITGFQTREVYYPDNDIFIAELFNCDCAPKTTLSPHIAGIALGKPLQKDIKVSPAILNEYVGTYALSIDTSRKVVIYKEKDGLMASISGQQIFPLVFSSDTNFGFKSVLEATCEFIRENNEVTKFVVYQGGKYEWNKMK